MVPEQVLASKLRIHDSDFAVLLRKYCNHHLLPSRHLQESGVCLLPLLHAPRLQHTHEYTRELDTVRASDQKVSNMSVLPLTPMMIRHVCSFADFYFVIKPSRNIIHR